MKGTAILLVSATLVAFAAVAAACGGGGGGGKLTLEEYFQKFDKILNHVDDAFATQDAGPTPAPDLSESELANYVKQSSGVSVQLLRDTAASAKKLSPPAEVEDEHNELVDSVDGLADVFEAVVAELPDKLSPSDLDTLDAQYFSGAELDTASRRVGTACQALQDIADQNDITVDLNCNG